MKKQFSPDHQSINQLSRLKSSDSYLNLNKMRFSYPLIIALSALSSVNAECWHSGPSTTKDAIADSVVTICNYLQSPGYLKGEERYQCVQDKNGVRWDFSLKVGTS